MVDKNNVELIAGDLILLTPDKVIEKAGELVIFMEMVERTITCGTEDNIQTVTTTSMKYYPLTELGLEVARYDNDEEQDTAFFRKTPYTVTNINSHNLLKMNPLTLSILNKEYYDEITAII